MMPFEHWALELETYVSTVYVYMCMYIYIHYISVYQDLESDLL